MVTWAQLALNAKDVKKSKFIFTIRLIVEAFDVAQKKFNTQTAPPFEFLTARLEKTRSHLFCFALVSSPCRRLRPSNRDVVSQVAHPNGHIGVRPQGMF